jgi:hypothetical protein
MARDVARVIRALTGYQPYHLNQRAEMPRGAKIAVINYGLNSPTPRLNGTVARSSWTNSGPANTGAPTVAKRRKAKQSPAHGFEAPALGPGAVATRSKVRSNDVIISSGSGNTMVVFFSAPISTSVCR